MSEKCQSLPKSPPEEVAYRGEGRKRDESKRLAGFFPDKLVSIENIKDGKHGHDNNDCCDCFN